MNVYETRVIEEIRAIRKETLYKTLLKVQKRLHFCIELRKMEKNELTSSSLYILSK